ncbi:hypothetical protein ACFWVT_25670 [Streptomyces cyaneofuscatus]
MKLLPSRAAASTFGAPGSAARRGAEYQPSSTPLPSVTVSSGEEMSTEPI